MAHRILARRPRSSLFAIVGGLLVAGCSLAPDEAASKLERPPVVGTASAAIATSNTVVVPVYFHFVYDHVNAATGLPAYTNGRTGVDETILDFDAELARFNAILAAAAPSGRAVRVVRAGVSYRYWTGFACSDLDPVTVLGPHRMYGAINVLAEGTLPSWACADVTTATYAIRTEPSALSHELGHALGLQHTFEGNSNWSTVEFLFRQGNDALQDSCYRRGDHICDTPPDYGYVGHDVCSTLIPGHSLCVQDHEYPFDSTAALAPCNPLDTVVDATGVCTSLGDGGGRRSYDPGKLGLYEDRPGNVMAYNQQSFLTREQFLRVHNYTQWRLRVPSRIPTAERKLVWDPAMLTYADGQNYLAFQTNRDVALTNANTWSASASWLGTVPTAMSATSTRTDGRRVLAVRVAASLGGTPSANARFIVTPPNGAAVTIPKASIRYDSGTGQWVADEAFAPPTAPAEVAAMRGRRSQGSWTVRVEDPSSPITVNTLSLSVVTSDRAQMSTDRQARGLGDILAYRPSENRLWMSLNNGAYNSFATGVYDAVGTPGTAMPIGGDVDGDGAPDLLAWDGSSLRVAFNADSYATWKPGAIAGSDLPTAGDELMLGDFDGDGFADLLRRRPDTSINRGRWVYYRGFGDGTFGSGIAPNIGGSNIAYVAGVHWTVGDFDGDGRTDLMVRENGSGLFWISRNVSAAPTSDGVVPTFAGGMNPSIGGSAYAYLDQDRLILTDVDGDGLDDLLVRRAGTGAWIVSRNLGGAQFHWGETVYVGGSTTAYLDTDVLIGASR